jgi:hypothetical protein
MTKKNIVQTGTLLLTLMFVAGTNPDFARMSPPEAVGHVFALHRVSPVVSNDGSVIAGERASVAGVPEVEAPHDELSPVNA